MITKESILMIIPKNLQDGVTDRLAELAEAMSSRGLHETTDSILENINHLVRTRQKIVDDGGDLDYALGRHLE